ncbi:hypothetical protein [uncultured Draconibacterium sp.]|uniref:hypothetical protein n=1 Tax=uncultured Draconibacterium sp. TaxID=1573823 RepID=UPI002AA9572A|nr:hypothetical protein [uncultured Draconibacterium sp.]
MTTKVADLTPDEFLLLLDDFYAEPKKRNKMTPEEVKDLAIRLNKKIDVPFIKETGEEKILVKVIFKIDTFLYDHLPNEFYDVIRSTDRGISDKEARRLVRRLTRLANKKIDIPYLPEPVEHFAIKFVIGMVVKAARKKLNFDGVRANSEAITVPDSDEDIEALVED